MPAASGTSAIPGRFCSRTCRSSCRLPDDSRDSRSIHARRNWRAAGARSATPVRALSGFERRRALAIVEPHQSRAPRSRLRFAATASGRAATSARACAPRQSCDGSEAALTSRSRCRTSGRTSRRRIEAGDTGLTVRLFPAQFADLHELQGGEQKTHECWLSFGGDGVSADAAGLVPVADAGVRRSGVDAGVRRGAVSGAAGSGSRGARQCRDRRARPVRAEARSRSTSTAGGTSATSTAITRPCARRIRRVVSHYNNQYDPVAGFILQFLRTGDPRWWTMAR